MASNIVVINKKPFEHYENPSYDENDDIIVSENANEGEP